MNDLGKQICRCIVGACDDTCKYYDSEKACCVGYGEVAEQAEKAFAEYEDYKALEEQGKLLRLPCAVGDKIYEPRPDREMVTEYRVSSLTYSGGEVFVGWQLNSGIYSNLDGVPANKIGKTVFLTRAEAEAALKELEGK